jgi:hypothetical protein
MKVPINNSKLTSLGALTIAIVDTLPKANDYNLHALDQVCLSELTNNTLTSPSKIESHGMATMGFNSLLIVALIVIVFSITRVVMSCSPHPSGNFSWVL